MREKNVTVPELMFIAGTRVALGIGIGLLLSDKLNKNERKRTATALIAIGVLTTIPIATSVFRRSPLDTEERLLTA